MKKIIKFINKNWAWILLVIFALVVLGVAVVPLCIFIAKTMWDIALNGPLPQY